MSVNSSGKSFCAASAVESVAPSITARRTSRQFRFEISIARDLGHEIEGAEQGNAIFHQRAERARELRIITMPDDAAVTRDAQAESVPCDPPFFASAQMRGNQSLSPIDEKDADPPIAHDQMMHLQRECASATAARRQLADMKPSTAAP